MYNGLEERGRKPMEITRELVERIAHLSRQTLSEDEKVRMSARLEDVLGQVTSLENLRLEELPEEDEMERGSEKL